MTRDEYNEAHLQLEREHRAAHKANKKAHGRPPKFTWTGSVNGERRVRTYAFLMWVKTPAATAWSEERLRIFAKFRQAHLDLKAAHPEFSDRDTD